MFIPRGEALYENLATSYVLVDALIDDLCEGGFSGLVEVVLRETDAHIVIDRGNVVVAVERVRDADYMRASIPKLAEMSRRERGRVSVYRYSKGVAAALGGRISAQPLYTGLSSDFTDLNRMISKFRRESDRQWFIEISTLSGITSLIHIEDDRCRMITSGAEQDVVESGQLDLAANSSLSRLLEECNNAGGTFDVYFKRAGEPAYPPVEEEPAQPAPAAATNDISDPEPAEPVEEKVAVESEVYHEPESASAAVAGASTETISSDESITFPSFISQPVDDLTDEEIEAGASDSSNEAESPASPDHAPEPDIPQSIRQEDTGDHSGGLSAATMRLLAMPPGLEDQEIETELDQPSEGEVMAEITRLMGEIARTVEQVVKFVEPGDSFSISLRAGQLKVADHYPFLDPFGAEFEYLEGQIVFVGKATPVEFVNGLTEALKLAASSLVQSSMQPSRMRAFITEDLNGLLERNLAEFQRYKLDRAIEEILSF